MQYKLYLIFGMILFLGWSELNAYSGEKEIPTSNEKGFYQGKMQLTVSGGIPWMLSGSFIDSVTENNKLTIPIWSNPYRAGIWMYSQSEMNSPRISSPYSYSIRENYGITERFAVGFRGDVRGYFAHGYSSSGHYLTLIRFLQENNYADRRFQEAFSDQFNEKYILTKEKKITALFYTGGIEGEFHFYPLNRFDPFLAAGYGQGRDLAYESRVDQLSLTAGINIYINDYFSIRTGFDHSVIKVSKTNDGYFLRKSPHEGILNDSRFEFGFSFSFSHLPTLPESDKSSEVVRLYRELQKIPEIELRIRDNHLTVIFLQDAIFPSGSDQMFSAGVRSVEKVAAILVRSNLLGFIVEGHTDSIPVRPGSKLVDNYRLSFQRADQVALILKKAGIADDRLGIRSFGPDKPRASNDTEAGRRINRRIEIVLLGDVKGIPELQNVPGW